MKNNYVCTNKFQFYLKKKMNIKCQGNDVRVPGDAVDSGLSIKAAAELGLLKGTPVGTSLIDAHAGGLGMIGCYAPEVSPNFSKRLGVKNY